METKNFKVIELSSGNIVFEDMDIRKCNSYILANTSSGNVMKQDLYDITTDKILISHFYVQQREGKMPSTIVDGKLVYGEIPARIFEEDISAVSYIFHDIRPYNKFKFQIVFKDGFVYEGNDYITDNSNLYDYSLVKGAKRFLENFGGEEGKKYLNDYFYGNPKFVNFKTRETIK